MLGSKYQVSIITLARRIQSNSYNKLLQYLLSQFLTAIPFSASRKNSCLQDRDLLQMMKQPMCHPLRDSDFESQLTYFLLLSLGNAVASPPTSSHPMPHLTPKTPPEPQIYLQACLPLRTLLA